MDEYYDLYMSDHPDHESDNFDNEEPKPKETADNSPKKADRPVKKEKFSLDFALDPDEEVNLDDESEKRSLLTIVETEKEEAGSESFASKRSALNLIDSFNLTPDQANQQFIAFLNRRVYENQKHTIKEQIEKDLKVDPNDPEVKAVIRELYEKNKFVSQNKIRNKDKFPYDIERLKDMVLALKEERNYDRAVIKLLKFKLNKIGTGTGTGATRVPLKLPSSATKTGTFKSVEDLEEELNRLKHYIAEAEKAYKIKISRMEIQNNKIMKILNADPQKIAIYNRSNEKAKELYEAENKKASDLRVKLNEANETIKKQQEKLSAKDDELIKLRNSMEDKTKAKQAQKIVELQQEVEALKKKNQETEANLALDRQLTALFPNSVNKVVVILNAFRFIESNRHIKKITKVVSDAYVKHTTKVSSWIGTQTAKVAYGMYYLLFRDHNYHPVARKTIQATLQAWNRSPEMVSTTIKKQEEEIAALKAQLTELQSTVKAYRRHTLTSFNKIPSVNVIPEKISETASIERDHSDDDEEREDKEENSEDEKKVKNKEKDTKEETKNEPEENPPIHPLGKGIRYEYSIEAYQETWKNWRNTPEMVKKFLQQQDEEIMRLRRKLNKRKPKKKALPEHNIKEKTAQPTLKKALADSDTESNQQTKQKDPKISKTIDKKPSEPEKKLLNTTAQLRPPSAEKNFRIKKTGTKPSNP